MLDVTFPAARTGLARLSLAGLLRTSQDAYRHGGGGLARAGLPGMLALTRVQARPLARTGDSAGLARAAAAEQARAGQELLDRVVRSLFQVGLSLQAAADLPGDVAREHIAGALGRLDDTIHEIRGHAFAARADEPPPP